MSYTRGAASAAQTARAAVERERAEVERLYAEGRALAQTAKQLRQRNANIEAKVAEERDRLEDKRARLNQTLADLATAQKEADASIREAEERAGLIRELAFDQARALAERAYAAGYSRGKDHARAKHALIQRVMPHLTREAPQKGVSTRSTHGVTTRVQA